MGIQLFHLPHQCGTPYRVAPYALKWDAGMLGSTHLLVPWPLTAMTADRVPPHSPCLHSGTILPFVCVPLKGEAYCRQGKKGGLWDRAGVNQVGLKSISLPLPHTYEGEVK